MTALDQAHGAVPGRTLDIKYWEYIGQLGPNVRHMIRQILARAGEFA